MTDRINISEELLEGIVKIRQHLHENPELSGEEFLTTKLINETLRQEGIKIIDSSLKTGVIAEIGSDNQGTTIALRADIDALPIQEETRLPYQSTNQEVMHACGHDFHTAALLGAATILKQKEKNLNGTIRLIFQPAEEINHGAKEMIETGALEGVTKIVGFHNKPDLPVGTIGIKSGPLMAAVDQFKVEIKGTGTHAAAPHNGNDPIVTTSQIITSLQSIISRRISPINPAVLSVTHIEGGNTWNVIPSSVFFEGTIRTFYEADQHNIKKLFEETIHHYTQAFGQTSQITWIESPPVLVNDTELAESVREVTKKFAKVIEPDLTLGGEDFANYLKKIPGVFAFIGTDSPFEWHHPEFLIDDDALPIAIEFYVANALALLNKSLDC